MKRVFIQHLKKNDIWEIKDCLGDTPAVCQFMSRADSLITILEGLRIFQQQLPYKFQPKKQHKLFKSIEKAATTLDDKLSLLKRDNYRDLATLCEMLKEPVTAKQIEKLTTELAWLSGLFERAANVAAKIQEFGEDRGIFQIGAGRPINHELATILDTLVTIYAQEFGKLPAYSKRSKFHNAVIVVVNRAGISYSQDLEKSLRAAIDRVRSGKASPISSQSSPI